MPHIDIQGHRGARALLPENSLPGFQLALDLGVNTLEMDTVVTKDHKVVLSHDPYFSPEICIQPDGTRIPDGSEDAFRLFDRTYDEIRSFDCGSIGNPRFPEQRPLAVRKPLLAEVIQFSESYASKIGRPAPFYNIETKSKPEGDDVFHPKPEVFVDLLVAVLREKNIVARSIVQSFDPRTLVIVRDIQPDLQTALLVENEDDHGVDANVENLGFTPAIYSPDWSLVTDRLVARCHELGMRVIPWTVNNPEEMRSLVLLGVDGIISDYPDRAMALMLRDWAE